MLNFTIESGRGQMLFIFIIDTSQEDFIIEAGKRAKCCLSSYFIIDISHKEFIKYGRRTKCCLYSQSAYHTIILLRLLRGHNVVCLYNRHITAGGKC
jgi:hypothetical protein